MAKSLLKGICRLAMVLVLFAPAVFADTFMLTGVNPALTNLGGLYTGPYVATINGVTGIQVICDDINTETYLNKLLDVTETKVSELDDQAGANQVVKFNRDDEDTQQTNYVTAAYLAIQMIGVDQSTTLGKLQAALLNYAIWYLFDADKDALDSLNDDQKSAAMGYLSAAKTATQGANVNMYANVSIWTPTPNSAAQEFISVTVPEPSVAGLLAFNALALVIVGLFLRRRGVRFAD